MKKFLTCLLALVMVLSLAACSGNDSGNSDNAGDTSGDSSSQTGGDTAGDASGSGDSSSGSGDAAFTTVEEGKIIMSTNASFPPYEMVDESGNIIGIDAEIAAALAEKLGLELEIMDMDFD